MFNQKASGVAFSDPMFENLAVTYKASAINATAIELIVQP